MSAGLQRTFTSLSVPNYRRYFTGQVISISGNWMQIVAEMWLIVQLTGSGVSVGADRGAAVPADAAVRRLGRPARRPRPQAPPAPVHAGADGGARAGAVDPHRDGRHRALDGVRARARPWLRARDRQPGAPGLRDGARRPGADRQRGLAQLRRRPLLADRRPRRRRHGDRAVRRRPLLRAQRALVHRDARRAAEHGSRRAARSRCRRSGRAATCGSRCATSVPPPPCGSRWARWCWWAPSPSTSRC